MKFISFASSSKGNCAFISYKDTNILVDCGISKKRVVENLAKIGKTLLDIDCIFVTHEHGDHIYGIPAVIKGNDIKVSSQRDTLKKIASYCEDKDVKVKLDNFKILRPVNVLNEEDYIRIKDIKIYPIKSSHDVPSVIYKFLLGDIKIAIATDLGVYTENTIRSLSDVNYLMLECNYDEELLLDNDNYSPALKTRIMSEGGHLSNVDCSNIIMRLASQSLKEVHLSHISEENNSEEYALEFVTKYLKENFKGKNSLPKICITKRVEMTKIIDN